MDLAKVLAHLHAELNDLDAAIASLQRLQHGDRRRGRPLFALQKSDKQPNRRKGKAKPDAFHAGQRPPSEDS
jgi:hypothetical protein